MVFNRLFESRSNSYQQLWANGDDVAVSSLAGTVVNSETAFQVNAVFSAISLISDTISTLPVDVFTAENGARFPYRPKPSWVDQPDVDLTRQAFYSQVIVSLLLDGNAFIRVYSNRKGEIVNLTTLNPAHVEVKRNGLGRLMFTVDGEAKPLTGDEVIWIPDLLRPGSLRGLSRVTALKENFGLALALEKFASTFFGSGTNLAGVIEFPGNLTQEQADNLRSGFDSRHSGWSRSNRTGVLSGGATFKETQADPSRSMLIESRRMAVEDVARAFNVPPHLLGLPGTTSYASVEQNNLAWVTHGLRPIVQKLEGAISPLMSRYPGAEGAFIRFNLDGLLRADMNARMSAYSVGLQSGFLSINDVRRLEDLSPVEDVAANSVRVPLANVNIDQSNISADRQKVQMAQMLTVAGFDPADVLRVVGIDPIKHTGLPSSQLQMVAGIDPNNPQAVYADEVK